MIDFEIIKTEWDEWCGINSPKLRELHQYNTLLPKLFDKRHEMVAYRQELESQGVLLLALLKRNKRDNIDASGHKVLFDKYRNQISFAKRNVYTIDDMIKRIMARLKYEDYVRKQH